MEPLVATLETLTKVFRQILTNSKTSEATGRVMEFYLAALLLAALLSIPGKIHGTIWDGASFCRRALAFRARC